MMNATTHPSRRRAPKLLPLLALLAAPAAARAQETIGPRPDYAAVARALEPFIVHELKQKGIPAISVALVDDQQIVWSRGFGSADLAGTKPATAETVHRVGSVSKLFTDLQIMRLVEAGELELDAPVTRYLPDFRPQSPWGKPITVRQLTSHRSGLTREPPAGHYFDDTAPTLAATVASLDRTRLVYEPETRSKYSNAGIAVLGYVLERTQGESFYPYLRRALLEPLGLESSAFEPLPALEPRLADALMWTYDGRRWKAPTFQLGMGPAGSLYTTVNDLGRFVSVLLAGGRTADGRPIVSRAVLDSMWTPQYARPGQKTGFGIGFAISELEGKRVVGHGGAIYGFATTLAVMPDDRLGAIVVATLDGANTTADRIAHEALRMMLATKAGKPLPKPDTTRALAAGVADRLQGRYAKGSTAVELSEYQDRLYLQNLRGGMRTEVRALGDALVVDDPLGWGERVQPLADGRLVVGRDTLARVPARRPGDSAPERRRQEAARPDLRAPAPGPEGLAPRPKPEAAPVAYDDYIGEYGWDHNVLYVLEKEGRLTALIEWFFEYPLEPAGRDTFAFPKWGLYDGQEIAFERDAAGKVVRAVAATVPFERRPLPGDDDAVSFRITPVRPVEELRRAALAATPPAERGAFREPDLVELRSLDPTIRYDIRYAGSNNFMGTPFYTSAHAFLQRPAAEAVARVSARLRPLGYGLLVHDAYRPWYVTKMFWDGTPAEMHDFVADPSSGSRHNRGAAVDLTLYDLKAGAPVRMTGGYDEFSQRSFPLYPGGTASQRWHRDLLRSAMEAEGFTVYAYEWWHFDYADWRHYPIGNRTFEELGRTAGVRE